MTEAGRRKAVLAAILVIAALLRLYFAFTCKALPDFSDMATYNKAAMAGGIPSFPPPGYPLFLRLVYSIFGALNYKAVFVIQALLSVLAVYLIYASAREVSERSRWGWKEAALRKEGRGVDKESSAAEDYNGYPPASYSREAEYTGLVAGAAAAVYPNFIAYNLTTLTESLSLLIVMLALYWAVSPIRDIYRSILPGLVLSLGFFVKPSLVFFAPGLFFGVRKKTVLVVTMAAVLGPYFIYGSLTGKGEGRGARLLYKAYNPKAAESHYFKMEDTELGDKDATDDQYISETVKFISSNKWKTLDIIYYKASLLVSRGWDSFVLKDIARGNRHLTNILMYAYLPVMIFGFIGLVRYTDRGNAVIALMVAGYLLIHIVITIFKIRYRLLIEPLVMIYAAIAVVRLWMPRESQ